jgi:hypothetical protein
LKAVDFQNRRPPPIAGIRDLMVTVTVTIPFVEEVPHLFHGMEDSIYNLQTSTLKTKDLEYSELLRKCSG